MSSTPLIISALRQQAAGRHRAIGSHYVRTLIVRCAIAVLSAWAFSIPNLSHATSDVSVRSAVEALLVQQWRQIGTGTTQHVANGQQVRFEEVRSTAHVTGWRNGEATERPDGCWEAVVAYQVEFTSGGSLSRYGTTATAVLRQDTAATWSAIRLESLHIKGGIVDDRPTVGTDKATGPALGSSRSW